MFKSIHKIQKRSTRQRTAMRRVFEYAERPLLAQEILRLSQYAVPCLDLTKFCRNLKVMIAGGLLAQVRLLGVNPRGPHEASPPGQMLAM